MILIGDSITGGFGGEKAGYALAVRQILAGQVLVDTLPANGGDSRNLLARLPEWLGETHYDLIHVNCGLHDIKRSHSSLDIQVPLDEYEANLHVLVTRLREQTTQLIWARTTPVIDGQLAPGKDFDRYNADVDAYNRTADQVMAEHSVVVNDLHEAILTAGIAICLTEDGVHMRAEGNRALARRVVESARRHLALGHERGRK